MHKSVIAILAAATLIPSAAMANRTPDKAVIVDRHRATATTFATPHRHPAETPIAVGAKLEAAYWNARYSIPHPARYHLARPAAHERWFRVRDHAVLVNRRSGRIVRIVHHRFR